MAGNFGDCTGGAIDIHDILDSTIDDICTNGSSQIISQGSWDVHYNGNAVSDIMDENDTKHKNSIDYVAYLEARVDLLEKIIIGNISEEDLNRYKEKLKKIRENLTKVVE